jgi:serine/threonine protein kinase
MDQIDKWERIKALGEGGQGKVYLVRDTSKSNKASYLDKVAKSILNLGEKKINDERNYVENWRMLDENLMKLIHADDPINLGALKVLHEAEGSNEGQKAVERMKREIKGLSKVEHPNILKILDFDNEGKWFVGEYHLSGPLSKHRELFRGRLLQALEAFRPLVDGVRLLHERGLIHRDIKPHNIFMAEDDHLVLGDLGIAFFSDDSHTRLSSTFENVGSRDWMPPWAMSLRVDSLKNSFDIFSLGKVLWSMVSGQPILQLWYFDRPQFNLEMMFPNDTDMRWANKIFEQCIVQEEEDCIPSAVQLLEVVDKTISALRRHADVIKEGIVRKCNICGSGKYSKIVDGSGANAHNFGIRPTGASGFKVFTCNNCGHVQLFHLKDINNVPSAWKQ